MLPGVPVVPGTGGTGSIGGTGGTGGVVGAPASVAPRLTHVAQSHPTWRAGGKLATPARTKTRPPVGTTFSFTLDQPARINLSFTQTLRGRAVGSRCVTPTDSNRHRRSCSRLLIAATLSFPGHSGVNRLVFQGRVTRSKRLEPGHYTVLVTATNAAGQRSGARSLSFTIAN